MLLLCYLVFFASPSPQLEVYLRRRSLKEGGVTLCSIQHLVRTWCCSAPLLGRLASCAPVEHRRRSAATPTARVYAVLISSGPARPHSMLCFHRIHYIPDSCLFCSAVLQSSPSNSLSWTRTQPTSTRLLESIKCQTYELRQWSV